MPERSLLRLCRLLVSVALAVPVISGCAARPATHDESPSLSRDMRIAMQSPSVELYSLDPARRDDPESGSWLGFGLLGRVRLDGEAAQRATSELLRAVDDSDGTVAMCFEPRHALRAQSGGHVYDFLLCYECLSMNVFVDGRFRVGVAVAGNGDALNGLLRERGIALAPIEPDDP
jgi:hypothetical protein